MAQGGFKAFEVEYIRTENPKYSTVLGEMNKIIKGVCVGLCQNAGWENDLDYTPTDDDFVTIGNTPTSSSDVATAGSCHFLKNSSGARLCVAYLCQNNYVNNTLMFCNHRYSTATSGTAYYRIKGGGLSLSMIPPGYEDEAWDVTNSCTNATFLPLHAIPFCCLASPGGSSNTPTTVVASTSSGINGNYIYTIIAKDNDIFFGCKKSGSSSPQRWNFIGRLFGILCNDADNSPLSHYSAWDIHSINSSCNVEYEGGGLVVGSADPSYYNMILVESITFWNNFVSDFQTWGSNTVHARFFYTNEIAIHYTNYTTNVSTGQAAFGAIGCALWCANPNTQGVVKGNGFKGYFDTDKIRMVAPAHPLGTLFNDGAFIHIGSGIAIGWDSSNTVNPFA